MRSPPFARYVAVTSALWPAPTTIARPITGASGAIYGIRILEVLNKAGVETHLVMSDSAKRTIVYETDYTIDGLKQLATHVHDINDVGACISSGSFRHAGMVIAPCSIKTLSALANSFNTNLLIRAADVTLKERRRLLLHAELCERQIERRGDAKESEREKQGG